MKDTALFAGARTAIEEIEAGEDITSSSHSVAEA